MRQLSTPRVASLEAYDEADFDPLKAIGYLVRRVRAQLLAALDAELAADAHLATLDVSAAQMIILVRLAAGDGAQSAADLCKGMSYDAGAMTRMLDRLESKGLLRRQRCPNDRRLVYLELTDKGRLAYPKLRAIARNALNHSLRGLTRADVRQLEGLLLRILENS